MEYSEDDLQRAIVCGLLGLQLDEPLPPNVGDDYMSSFSNMRDDREYVHETEDKRTYELGYGWSR